MCSTYDMCKYRILLFVQKSQEPNMKRLTSIMDMIVYLYA